MSCPVTNNKDGVCPVTKKTVTIVNEENQFESKEEEVIEEEEDDEFSKLEPNEREYKKLQKTMTTIKVFYMKGTEKKQEQLDFSLENLEKIQVDEEMINCQLEAFNKDEKYMIHLKQIEYMNLLTEEKKNLLEKKSRIEEQKKNFEELVIWSKVIVKVCEWLEENLESYCIKNLELKIENPKKVRDLTEEETLQYAKGLDEIMNNLKESQDFFNASVDGRLLEFQYMENEIINSQLDSIKKFDDNNPRKIYLQEQLLKDLEYNQQRISSGENETSSKQREKIKEMHRDFLKLLTFFKDKWSLLNNDLGERKYDPKFTKVFVYN
jgi:hypothetical protein